MLGVRGKLDELHKPKRVVLADAEKMAFMSEPQFERVLGGRVTGDVGDNGRSVKLLCGNRRRGLAIRLVPNMGYMVYELTDPKMDPEEAVQKILMLNDARPAFPFRVT